MAHRQPARVDRLERIAVIDFETTGMSPALADRATEIAVVMLEHGRVVDRFHSLMNAGVWVSPFIQQLTGISNAMLRAARPAAEVMEQAARFVGDTPLLAHNAAFDQKFWDAELARIGRQRQQAFACSLLLARRLLPQAPNHKLGSLHAWAGLPPGGRAHRALADAEMAANLTQHLIDRLRSEHGVEDVDHRLLCRLQRIPRQQLAATLAKWRQATALAD